MHPSLITKNFGSGGRADEPTTWSRRNITQTWGPGAEVETTQCVIQFGIPKNITAPVLFYYKLTNFYQNHRRYAKSFSIDQLNGKAISADSIDSGDCQPLTSGMDGDVKKPYYPCGLAANSVFNDTFESPIQLDPQFAAPGEINRTYTMNDKDISWKSDQELYGKTDYQWENVLVPPNWEKRYPNGYTNEHHPDLKNDQHFQVWMRLAGLPTFSKLYMRNDQEDMAAGTYTINIFHSTFKLPRRGDLHIHTDTDHFTDFPVTEYGGTKSIIITSKTVMGGKNPFLGIAYIVVGGICVILGVLFTVTHLIKPRKLGDHTYLSWNNDQPSTATTTGRDGGAGAEQRA